MERLIGEFTRSKDGLTAKIEELRDATIGASRKWFDKTHLCALREVNEQYFNGRPHLLPNFGVPDDRYPRYRWHRSTVAEWIDTPMSELKQRWDRLSDEDRQDVLERRKNPEVVDAE